MEYFGNIILPDGILSGARVICKDGVITEICPNGAERSNNLPYIAPGFVDIHNHGALGHDYMQATPQTFRTVARYLASRGITSAQCTTVSAPLEQLERFMAAFRQYQQSEHKDCCRYVGIHVEGPYIAPSAKGAHRLDTLLTPREHGYDWILNLLVRRSV